MEGSTTCFLKAFGQNYSVHFLGLITGSLAGKWLLGSALLLVANGCGINKPSSSISMACCIVPAAKFWHRRELYWTWSRCKNQSFPPHTHYLRGKLPGRGRKAYLYWNWHSVDVEVMTDPFFSHAGNISGEHHKWADLDFCLFSDYLGEEMGEERRSLHPYLWS